MPMASKHLSEAEKKGRPMLGRKEQILRVHKFLFIKRFYTQ